MRKFNCVTFKCLSTKQTHHTLPIHLHIWRWKCQVAMEWIGYFRKTTPDHEMTWFWPGRCFAHAVIWNAYRDVEMFCRVFSTRLLSVEAIHFSFSFYTKREETNSRWFLQDVRPLKFSFFFSSSSSSSLQHNTLAPMARKWNILLLFFNNVDNNNSCFGDCRLLFQMRRLIIYNENVRCFAIFAYIPDLLYFSWPQAKQRASVQWLLSKSYSHQVPEDVKEPFYRDVEVKK